MMKLAKHRLLVAALAFLSAVLSARSVPNIALVGGHWFDGGRVQDRTMYVASGILSRRRPLSIDSTVARTGTKRVFLPWKESFSMILRTPIGSVFA